METIATLVAFGFIFLIAGIALHAAFRIPRDDADDSKEAPK
jgi:hypothetical protein